ncbi:CDP-diacylglycerol--serine O-phosphatidyltransferase [Pontibacter actiniarum]|uniref:CDP-diacylglycerol--serine O-phosphatidyltransferase n=1 Tax=Pontibacter actiniarum TaxID=323450 RepID=A0A1X9YUG4_9BACT|nr:CDP-diacylglycerol--serine O-phosphatidyltransferase [Pontibacter actiniarum]ARS36560.1 CDP-diacylglycerol--serine O-phosphatidyltransferase [Pontibacter actiniarum]
MKKHIPNVITCLNLLSGCLALYFAFKGELVTAAYLVGIAAIFDFMDGMIARLIGAYSEIGKQLDSLADMVSFGVVPGTIMFMLLQRIEAPFWGIPADVVPFAGFLITIFSALRLAKFNIDTRQTTSFIGLPTPACTLFVASLPLILETGDLIMFEIILNQPVLLVLTVMLSFLLVAELPLFALKFKNFTWQDNSIRFIFLGLSVILVAMLKFAAIPLIIVLYVLLSIIKKTSHTS